MVMFPYIVFYVISMVEYIGTQKSVPSSLKCKLDVFV